MQKLIVGKEYWFDRLKRQRGIFVKTENNCSIFKHTGGTRYYIEDDAGLIGFEHLPDEPQIEFTLVEEDGNSKGE